MFTSFCTFPIAKVHQISSHVGAFSILEMQTCLQLFSNVATMIADFNEIWFDFLRLVENSECQKNAATSRNFSINHFHHEDQILMKTQIIMIIRRFIQFRFNYQFHFHRAAPRPRMKQKSSAVSSTRSRVLRCRTWTCT